MKWFSRLSILAVMVAALGCNAAVKEVAPVETGAAPSDEKMKEMMDQSRKHMSPEQQSKVKSSNPAGEAPAK